MNDPREERDDLYRTASAIREQRDQARGENEKLRELVSEVAERGNLTPAWIDRARAALAEPGGDQ